MVASRSGWPSGDSASKRIDAGAFSSSAPVNCWRSLPCAIRTSASARRSENSCHRAARRATARCASSVGVSRGGGTATVQPAASETIATRLLRRRPLTLEPLQPRDGVLDLLLHPVCRRIELERSLPRRDRLLLESVLRAGVAEVLIDHRIRLACFLHRALELAKRVGVAALLVIGPAEAVDEVAVVGLELERLRDQMHRFVEVLPALGVHVADVVVGLRVLGIELDDVAE